MQFSSDNCGPVHPRVMQALAAVNSGYVPSYGNDPLMDEVQSRIRNLFEAPQAEVYLVATGTAANVLALSCYAQPWDTIFCTPMAHIAVDECNAPEFFSGGAKLTFVGDSAKMTPDALADGMEKYATGDVHMAQAGLVSLTNVTECGTLYTTDEIGALSAVAKGFGAPVHLDGARFSNAVAAMGCTPPEMSWKAGVDVLSFGGTKNGLMGAEAVVLFDPAKAREFELRRKRGAHLLSKHRYLSAQMAAYLRDNLWLETAKASNAAMARLVTGLRARPVAEFVYPPQANMLFVSLPRALHRKLLTAGAVYTVRGSLEGPDETRITARLVCDWAMDPAEIDRFLALIPA